MRSIEASGGSLSLSGLPSAAAFGVRQWASVAAVSFCSALVHTCAHLGTQRGGGRDAKHSIALDVEAWAAAEFQDAIIIFVICMTSSSSAAAQLGRTREESEMKKEGSTTLRLRI